MNKKVIGAVGFILVLIVWSLVYIFRVYHPLLVPSPVQVVKSLFTLLIDKGFMINLLATFARVIIAIIISSLLGIVSGLLLGYYKMMDRLAIPMVDFIRSIPGIVLFPLFILMFGVGDTSRLLVAIFIAFPIITINTRAGVINSNEARKNLCKLYKIGKLDMFYKVILPEASPYIFTGLKVAVSLTLIVVIVTEMMLGTQWGLGQLLITSQYRFDTPIMYSIIIVLGLIGCALNFGFDQTEKRIFHWR